MHVMTLVSCVHMQSQSLATQVWDCACSAERQASRIVRAAQEGGDATAKAVLVGGDWGKDRLLRLRSRARVGCIVAGSIVGVVSC